MDTTTPNLSASMSRYGYPLATFDPIALTISRRVVIVDAILWDEEFDAYRASGYYARKDGSAGRQVAKPLAFGSEVPEDVRAALEAIRKAA